MYGGLFCLFFKRKAAHVAIHTLPKGQMCRLHSVSSEKSTDNSVDEFMVEQIVCPTAFQTPSAPKPAPCCEHYDLCRVCGNCSTKLRDTSRSQMSVEPSISRTFGKKLPDHQDGVRHMQYGIYLAAGCSMCDESSGFPSSSSSFFFFVFC